MNKKVNNAYIGVFDSGIGGLTALKDLVKQFPNERFLYLGDTARCPYGRKTREELEKIVESDVRYFERRGAKMVVIACNTATANSYHIESTMPIIRIIEPTCDVVKKQSGRTAILATNFTISSKAYNRFLGDDIDGIGCSEWVDIIEAGETNTEKSKESVERLLSPVKGKVQNAVLACTHFGLLESEIKDFMGQDLNVINSSLCLKGKIEEALEKLGYNEEKPEAIINITGEPEKLNIGWLKKDPYFKDIKINKVDIND